MKRMAPFLAGFVLLGSVACGPTDPAKERARWTVQALDWVQTPEDEVRVTTRVSGPPNAKIEKLTVRFELRDAAEELVVDHWHTFDLTQIERGGPKDLNVFIPAGEVVIDSLGLDRMLAPSAEQLPRIPELQ